MQVFTEEEPLRKKEEDEVAAVDEGPAECLPDFSMASMLCGILEPGHPTISGERAHIPASVYGKYPMTDQNLNRPLLRSWLSKFGWRMGQKYGYLWL